MLEVMMTMILTCCNVFPILQCFKYACLIRPNWLFFLNSDMLILFINHVDILYLNKQRLSAMEKLEKCEEENQMLRAKVQELDAKVKENLVKGEMQKCYTPIVQWKLILTVYSNRS